MAELAARPALGHLTALFLGDNRLTDDHLGVLARSPHLHNLRELWLQSNHLGAAAAGHLAAAPACAGSARCAWP